MKFVDTAEIHVKAGDGGVGCSSFRREKFIPRGGPDGGNGGRGGDVIFRANRQLSTLLDFRYKRSYEADRGEHGLGSRKTGKSAKPVVIQVPVGTLVTETDGAVVADLVEEGHEVIVAKGGRGGRGNASYASSTNQAPRTFEQGKPGEDRHLVLELKLLADVGLVGLPNSGKSTLISKVSAARPKIADYPFTTIVPNLGIVPVREGEGFVMADIPGLIQGAHDGKGLGHQFLRHIERTRILLFLVDSSADDPMKDYDTLIEELRSFSPDLLEKPRLVAVTKRDLIPENGEQEFEEMTFKVGTGTEQAVPHFLISAVSHVGVSVLISALWDLLRTEKVDA